MGIIVSAGCSYAHGYGLANKDDRYAALISEYSGHELIDMSTSGSSNDYIASCAVAGVNAALKKAAPQQIALVIGWTTQSRIEYFDKDERLILSIMTAYRGLENEYNIGGIPRERIASALWHPAYGYYRFLCGFQRVESFCKDVGVKVIHLQNINLHPIPFEDTKCVQSRFRQPFVLDNLLTDEQREKLGLLLEQQSFQVVCKSKKLLDNTVHPTAVGHSMWAHMIMEKYGYTLGV